MPLEACRRRMPWLRWRRSMGRCQVGTLDGMAVELCPLAVVLDEHVDTATLSHHGRTLCDVVLMGDTKPKRIGWLRKRLPTIAHELMTRVDDPDAQHVGHTIHHHTREDTTR